MFTEGPVRYRLEFIARGHQRQAIRTLADHVYGLCPSLLNDSRNAFWQVNVFPDHYPAALEISPRLRPDPRFAYRQGDVPAASHPPLAACMARLAGLQEADSVWDPFCGSGLELIERALRGGVKSVLGTDRSSQALEAARANFHAAGLDHISSTFLCSDFRDAENLQNAFSLVMSNPPMGRRVPIPDLAELIADFFVSASHALKPGGRLVFVNPLTVSPRTKSLELASRQKIDMGGFHAHLEKYIKRKS
jgi:tRNA G10  N-methylase Trm11